MVGVWLHSRHLLVAAHKYLRLESVVVLVKPGLVTDTLKFALVMDGTHNQGD